MAYPRSATQYDRGGSHVQSSRNDTGFASDCSHIQEERLSLMSKNHSRTPLPLFQLMILCLMRIAETTAYTQVLDFRT